MNRKTYSDGLVYVTLTVVDWIDVFTRRQYCDCLIENLMYCQENKKLRVYAYVFMTNHLHMIVGIGGGRISDVLRDFKTFTSKELVKLIRQNKQESRKQWLLERFKMHGKQNAANSNHQFWQNGHYPVALYSDKVIEQKINYIHQNPVRAGFVDRPENYYYSSANPGNPLGVCFRY